MKKNIADILNEPFSKIILANPRRHKQPLGKVFIRRIQIKGQIAFQREEFRGMQAFHNNMSQSETEAYLHKALSDFFREAYVLLDGEEWQCRLSKDCLQIKVNASQVQRTISTCHNKEKTYILPQGRPIPALIELGVMDRNGNVFKNQRDKYIQINNFLAILNDAMNRLPPKKHWTILDLCCGKSYLTFVLYYFMKEIRQQECHVIGVDLKKDVIQKCTQIKQRLGFQEMDFIEGDIAAYNYGQGVDVVVSLHACDTATDIVLKYAMKNQVKLILSVPCCHKELAKQIQNKMLEPVLKYGLLKERFAALLTDGLRANVLENNGYRADVIEFVNFENSPKNVMIRAIWTGKKQTNEIQSLIDAFQITPSILTPL